MKKLLILLILFIFLLSGCIYNPTVEFSNLVEELDTPYKICQYMQDNFEIELHDITLTPYELYLIQKGDCDDFSTFAVFIANYHDYKTYQIKIYYKDVKNSCHQIAVYKENKYSFSDNQLYFSATYNTFLEIVEYDCALRIYPYNIWRKYIVYDYNMNIIERVIK